MSVKRKRYTSSEKAKIALEAIKGEQTLAQISSKYGVHTVQICAWKKQLLAYLPDLETKINRKKFLIWMKYQSFMNKLVV